MDRTTLETWQEVNGMETDEYGFAGEGEYLGEGEFLGEGEYLGEGEFLGEGTMYGEAGMFGEAEMFGEAGLFSEAEGVFNEADEMALAAELLSVNSEEELDQFLGKLIRKASRTVGKAITSPVGRQIGGMLKGVARRALPMIGSSVGNFLIPGFGGYAGARLASAAGSKLFGLELEGLSTEDQQFEIARRFVRLGGGAIRQAAYAPYGRSPQAVARSAMLAASRRYAPGLLRPYPSSRSTGAYGAQIPAGVQQGRWFRSRSGRIVLVGA